MWRILLISCLLLCGCRSGTQVTEKHECVRVFMHLPGEYSVLVNDSDEGQLRSIAFYYSSMHVDSKIVADVPYGKPMWYTTTKNKYVNGDFYLISVEIHVHSEASIEGAGWIRGSKNQTKGQTQVIE